MANAALFIGWNRVVPGREPVALEAFQRAVGLYTRLQSEGKIESFEPIFMSPHGGDLNGFFLLRGDRDALHKVRWSEEFQDQLVEAALYVQDLGVSDAYVGDGATTLLQRWARHVQKLPR